MPNSKRFIEESELILSNGRIYHLNLLPEEIAQTVIIVGDPERVGKVSKYFDRIEVKQQKREFVTHTGYIGNQRLSVLSTGMSTDNIDIVLNELDALHSICFESRSLKGHKPFDVIRIGTSGGIQEDIEVDSFLMSKAAVGFDGLLHFYNVEYSSHEKQFLDQLHVHFESNLPTLPYISHVANKFEELFGNRVQQGVTATCAGFYAPQGRHLRAQPKHVDFVDRLANFKFGDYRFTNFEMETAGIYGLGNVLGINCCSLNLMINNRQKKIMSQDLDTSMDRLIQMTLERLSSSDYQRLNQE